MPDQLFIGLATILAANYGVGEFIKHNTYTGDRFGLVDQNNRELIPAKYSSINHLGHGIFECEGIDASDRFCRSGKRYLFNRHGMELTPPLAADCSYWRLLWLGAKAEAEQRAQRTVEAQNRLDTVFDSLPDDAVLIFQNKERKLGLCDREGNIIAQPVYSAVGEGDEGFAILYSWTKEKSGRDRGRTYIADLRKHKVDQLDFNLQNIWGNKFSDGLAKVEASSGLYGYINTQGKFQIGPRFHGAGDFANGTACVIQSFGTSTVNQRGEIISPKTLDVRGFRGDYAVAYKRYSKGTRLAGLVNRDYKFVLEPTYLWIRPLGNADDRQLDEYDSAEETAKVYVGSNDKPPKVALSSAGTVLFEFPATQTIDGIQYNLIRCNGAKQFPEWQRSKSLPLYLNMNGEKVVPPQFANGEIAPDRFVKRLPGDDGQFDSEYWKAGRQRPISRSQMYKNFVRSYPLIGMKRQAVTNLLGENDPLLYKNPKEPPHLEYALDRTFGCVLRELTIVKIFYDNFGVVTGWCYCSHTPSGRTDGPLVTSNDAPPG